MLVAVASPATRSRFKRATRCCAESESADSGGTPGSAVAAATAAAGGPVRGSHSGKGRPANGAAGTEAAEGADAELRRKMRDGMRDYEREVAVNCGCF